MKTRKLVRFVGAATLLVMTTLSSTLQTDAQSFAMKSMVIRLNGVTISHPYSFVSGGTTYMPIWYVMQLAKKQRMTSTWSGQVWNLMTGTSQSQAISPFYPIRPGNMQIDLNGTSFLNNVPKIIYRDPSTRTLTTYIPIYYVMKLFRNELSLNNTWDGQTWSVSSNPHTTPATSSPPAVSIATSGTTRATTSGTIGVGASLGSSSSATTVASQPFSPPTLDGNPVVSTSNAFPTLEGQTIPHVTLQNGATNDQAYWSRASRDFYLSAQTSNPVNNAAQSLPIANAQPDQTLYLFAYKNGQSVNANQTTFLVNSPDATLATNSNETWTQGSNQIAYATFRATKPGVYTVQAATNGQYSVPLVITVGLSQLNAQPFSVPTAYTGILPLPSTGLTSITSGTDGHVSFSSYAPVGNWIPISGTVSGGLTSISILLNSGNNSWDYRLPVDASGHFSGMIESPFTGQVELTYEPNYLTLLTSTSGSLSFNIDQTLTISGTTLSPSLQGLLPSAAMNSNMSNTFMQTADQLLENSPSFETAIAAINNYVAGDLSYNVAEASPGGLYVWKSATTTWSAKNGICENFAELEASLLHSVGIPVQTVGGNANANWTTPNYNDKNASDAHEWLSIYTGGGWLIADPTWTGMQDANGRNFGITNEFFTNTTSFTATHATLPGQTGTNF